jgi:HK97 gp10 family phage protein
MAGVEFKLRGAKALEAALKEIGSAPSTALGVKAVKAGSEVIAKTAQATSAFTDRSGRLRKSIEVEDTEKKPGEVTSNFGSEIFYGSFLEFGTQHIAPRSWLRKAMDESATAALQTMLNTLEDGIEKIAAKHRTAEDISAPSAAILNPLKTID